MWVSLEVKLCDTVLRKGPGQLRQGHGCRKGGAGPASQERSNSRGGWR